MLILLKYLGPCPRCDGQLEEGPDGPQCLHCGRGLRSSEEPPLPEKEGKEPRDTQLADDGCVVARSCLACPLPRCKYELVAAWRNEP